MKLTDADIAELTKTTAALCDEPTATRTHLQNRHSLLIDKLLAALKEARAEVERLNKWGAVRRLNDEWEAEAAKLRAKVAELERDAAMHDTELDHRDKQIADLERDRDALTQAHGDRMLEVGRLRAHIATLERERDEARTDALGQARLTVQTREQRDALRSQLADAREALEAIRKVPDRNLHVSQDAIAMDNIARAALAKLDGGK